MRRLIQFPCAGETLVGTLDEAAGSTGLLIVSGGNEIRVGAHRGMAELAGKVAAAGHPVLRYDRRGIGDSSGTNHGFLSTSEELFAAASTFRREAPNLTRIVAFGNCDAASALILFHAKAQIDALVLTNPWTIEATDDLPPASAIRSRYIEKLKDPRELLRLVTGGVNLRKLASGLTKAASSSPPAPSGLPAQLAAALNATTVPVTILLAERDNTAIAFADHWHDEAFAGCRDRVDVQRCATDSHSFARPADKTWLTRQVLAALAN